MKIATWNVNSIRTRLDHTLDWLKNNPVDALCLQETKVKNENFPLEAFKALGLNVAFHGQPAYNGVAIISSHPIEHVETGFLGEDLMEQKRVMSAFVKGVQIINVYAPQGESVDSPKFQFKENFYAALHYMLEEQFNAEDQVVLCGDLNIAPAAADVSDAEAAAGKCMFTAMEHEWLGKIINWGLVDTFRLHNQPEKTFSWWDYRQNSFKRNKGMRIDHVLATQSLADVCVGVEIFKETRGWERPSDHSPVVAEFEI